MFAAVDSLAEGCVAADCSSRSYGRGSCGGWLGSGLTSVESQTAAPLKKSDSSVCRYLGDLPSMLSRFESVLLDQIVKGLYLCRGSM